jgi:hypothetical protein
MKSKLYPGAPLNRAVDMLKTARELRAPHVAEVTIIGDGGAEQILGTLFKAAGWLVIYENRRRIQNKGGAASKLEKRKDAKRRSVRRHS